MSAPTDPDDDLAGVDLSELDLDGLEEEPPPGNAGRWLALVVLVALGALVLWLPTTDELRSVGARDNGLFFVLAGAGVVVGILLGRLLWRWGLEASRAAGPAARAPAAPPSPLWRWLTLAAVLAGGVAILAVPASSYYQAGDRYGSTWFIAAGGAVVVGVLLGRWLLMQAATRRSDAGAAVVLPRWVKWVTLALILATAVVVLVAKIMGGNEPGAFEFSLGAGGFVAGVGGAIWLARRFDEWERASSRRNQGGDRGLSGSGSRGTP